MEPMNLKYVLLRCFCSQVSVWPTNVKEFSPEHLEYFFNSEDGVLDSNGEKKVNAKVATLELH